MTTDSDKPDDIPNDEGGSSGTHQALPGAIGDPGKSNKNFSIFLLVFFVITLVVIKPLSHGIVWGAVFAFLWHPVHRFSARSAMLAARPNLRTSISFALLIVAFALPLAYVLRAIYGEIAPAYGHLTALLSEIRKSGVSLDSILPRGILDRAAPFIADEARMADFLTSLARSLSSLLGDISKGVLQWTGSMVFQGFVALTTMFFLIRDGEAIALYARDFLPLAPEERVRFMSRTGAMMNSVAYGVFLTVGVQAALGGVAWRISGLPDAFLASAAMFLCGMFPMGTAVVWGPGAIYLIVTGHTAWGVGLLAWGVIVVSSIDNILRPLFIRGASIPTLAIILGITGGIASWGLLGVFLGPLAIAIFLSVLDMYKSGADAESA
jgi:predicted PurR-regulated permease PerM